jgi:hypothetical protein
MMACQWVAGMDPRRFHAATVEYGTPMSRPRSASLGQALNMSATVFMQKSYTNCSVGAQYHTQYV